MIHDQFSGRRGLSRQRRWQLRKLAAGRCCECGQRRSRTNRNYCEHHRQLRNQRRKTL